MVGISLLTLVPGEVGGAETYARGLCRGLARAGSLDYTAFTPPVAPGAGGGLREVQVPEYRAARTIPQRLAAMGLAAARPGPLRRRLGRLDAVHYPLAIALPSLDVPTAVTILDLQHLDHPELFSHTERLFRRYTHERSARGADAVIAISQFVRQSVIERLGVPPERVRAIHLGVDHRLYRPGGEPRERFLLYPARRWPHKNHERLFEAFALVRREQPDLELVLTGGGHTGRPVPDGVRVLGHVPEDELASLYRRAACLVFPSLYEGFGMPPLEAMACGCPVAASRSGSLPEACGDAAALFDPLDPEEIAAVTLGVLDNPAPFVAAGLERAARFTWEATAQAHDEVYRQLLA
jgi:glycosyltransferase involved in cell wall biosynthesis